MKPPTPSTQYMLVAEAQQIALDRITEGSDCLCCGQFVREYRRHLNRSMVRALLALYRAAGGTTEYVHSPTVLGPVRGEEARLSYWGFIEELKKPRPDGGRRGYWRVTAKGEFFLEGGLKVPGIAVVFDGRLRGLRGNEIDIKEALGNAGFNLRDLMGDTQ